MKAKLLCLSIIIPILMNCDRILSPDSLEMDRIFYGANGKIYVMNEDGSNKKCITDFIDPNQFESVGFADLHRNKEKILFEYINYENQIEIKTGIMNLNGSDHYIFNNAKYRPLRPILSNDGNLILFSASGDSSGLFQMAVDGSNIVCLSDSGVSISFSKRVAGTNDVVYVKRIGQRYDLYRRNLEGNNDVQLTNKGDLYTNDFCISPDGEKIAYSSSNRLYLMNSDGTGTKEILDQKIVVSLTISNNNIAYAIMSENGFDIKIVNSNGENQQIIANTGRPDDNDYWRPNILFSTGGKQLFYTGYQDSNFDIFSVDIDGENPINITESPEHEYLGGIK